MKSVLHLIPRRAAAAIVRMIAGQLPLSAIDHHDALVVGAAFESRKQRRTDPLDETAGHAADGPGPGRLAYSAEIQRSVNAALEDLTSVERTAFVLRHYEGRSIKEICRILDVGTSAAKHGIFRAVRKLRARLDPLRETTRVAVE